MELRDALKYIVPTVSVLAVAYKYRKSVEIEESYTSSEIMSQRARYERLARGRLSMPDRALLPLEDTLDRKKTKKLTIIDPVS